MVQEKRLIDAYALKDRFKLRIDWLEKDKHDDYTTGIWDGCLYDEKLIDEAPTVDAVEVVRCKDCLYYHEPCKDFDYHYCTNGQWGDSDGWAREIKLTDFCSYGERRCE